MNLLGGAGDLITAAGFRAAWTGVRWLPEPAAYALFDRIADVTVLRGEPDASRRTIARSGPT